MTKRRRRTAQQRLAILKAHSGKCYLCGGEIQPTDGFELEHVIALELSGDDTDDNLRPAHKKCHAKKTADDLAVIAKAKRREVKHHGAAPPKQKIKSRGFPRKERKEKTALPPRRIYQ